MRCLTITKKIRIRSHVSSSSFSSTCRPHNSGNFSPSTFDPHHTKPERKMFCFCFLFSSLLSCSFMKKKKKFCDEMIILTITSLIVYCTGIGHQVTKSSLALAVSLPSINNFHSDAELEELRPSEEEIGGLAR